MNEAEMKEVDIFDGHIDGKMKSYTDFDKAYSNYRNGLIIVGQSYIKLKNIYDIIYSRVERFTQTLGVISDSTFLDMEAEVKGYMNGLWGAVELFEQQYNPTVFINTDKSLDYVYNFENKEFTMLRDNNKLVWLRADGDTPVGLSVHYKQKNEIDKVSLIPDVNNYDHTNNKSVLFDIKDIELFAYETEKEIYREYRNMLRLMGNSVDILDKLHVFMRIKGLDPQTLSRKKEKTKIETIEKLFIDDGYNRFNELLNKEGRSINLKTFVHHLGGERNKEKVGHLFHNLFNKGWIKNNESVTLSRVVSQSLKYYASRNVYSSTKNNGGGYNRKTNKDLFEWIPPFDKIPPENK